MAAAILSTQSLVSRPIIEDLIVEVSPRMERADSRSFRRIYSVVQASVDAVAAACRDVTRVPTVIAEERRRVMAGGPVCVGAFELFVKNLEVGD